MSTPRLGGVGLAKAVNVERSLSIPARSAMARE